MTITWTDRPLGTFHSGGLSDAYANPHGSLTLLKPQVAETIHVVDQMHTPILAALEKTRIGQRYMNWLVDQYADPKTYFGGAGSSTPAIGEDHNYTPAPEDSPSMLANYTQMYGQAFGVTDQQEEASKYGYGSQIAYDRMKKYITIGRVLEGIMLFSLAPSSTGYANTSEQKMSLIPRTHGLFGWACSTGDSGSDVTIAGALVDSRYSATYWAGPGGSADMTDTDFQNYILEPYVNAGNQLRNTTCMVPWAVKRVMSGWNTVYPGVGDAAAQVNHRNIGAAERKLNMSIDYFETDYGTLEVIPSWYLSTFGTQTGYGSAGSTSVVPSKSLLMFDESELSIAVFQDYRSYALGRGGPQSRLACEATMGLRVGNPKALAVALSCVA